MTQMKNPRPPGARKPPPPPAPPRKRGPVVTTVVEQLTPEDRAAEARADLDAFVEDEGARFDALMIQLPPGETVFYLRNPRQGARGW